MNKNIKYNLYFSLLLWFLFVNTYETLAYSINSISSIIWLFDDATLDSIFYLFSYGDRLDPFFLIPSKIAFFLPLVFLLIIPYFLEKEKKGRNYFFYYNINRKNYYLLVDIITFAAHLIFLIPGVFFSFGLLTSLPLFLFIIGFRVYQYNKRLIF